MHAFDSLKQTSSGTSTKLEHSSDLSSLEHDLLQQERRQHLRGCRKGLIVAAVYGLILFRHPDIAEHFGGTEGYLRRTLQIILRTYTRIHRSRNPSHLELRTDIEELILANQVLHTVLRTLQGLRDGAITFGIISEDRLPTIFG